VIEISGVYTAVALNCQSRSFTIRMAARNPDSFLDIRSAFIPYFLISASLLYSTATFLWLLNSFCHSKFQISAHTAIGVSFCLRAVSLYFQSVIWTDQIANNSRGLAFDVLAFSMTVFSLAAFFAVNLMLISGWGVYRDSMSRAEIVPLGSVTVYFFLFKAVAASIETKLWLLPGVVALGNLVLFLGYASMGIYQASQLLAEYGAADGAMAAKLQLILAFGHHYFKAISIGAGLALSLILLPVTRSVSIAAEEVFYVCFLALDFRYFWITSGHRGSAEVERQAEEGVAVVKTIEEPGEEAKIVCLTSPVGP
jgi:hypothetical protein